MEDVEDSLDLQATIGHECIHAILRRTNIERLLYGIKSGTGIEELKGNGRNNRNCRLGRGANEGLTEWICGKVGFKNNAYPDLKNIIDKLELAIGEEKVMMLGKGNINGNIAKQLGMNVKECQSFLAQIDNVHNILYEIIPDVIAIEAKLDKYKNKNILTDNERMEIEQEYLHIQDRTSEYWDNISGIEDEYESKGIWQKDIDEQIEFFREIDFDAKLSANDSIEEINSKIFEKYFKKEFDDLIQTDYMQIDKIPLEKMEKFKKLYDLMEFAQFSGVKGFKEDFESFSDKCFIGACIKVDKEFKDGTLSTQKLKKLSDLVNRDLEPFDKKFLSHISNSMCPKNPEIFSSFLATLITDNKIDDINQYSIVKISAENEEFIAYKKNGRIDDIDKENYYFENSEMFDFTLDEDEDEVAIILDFMELKKNIKEKNPNSKMRILDRVIIVENEEKQDVYIIAKGKILPANIEELEGVNVRLKEDEPEVSKFPIKQNKNLFQKITDILKGNSQRIKLENANLYGNGQLTSRQESFRNTMKDKSLYDNTTQIIDNVKPIEQNKEDKSL